MVLHTHTTMTQTVTKQTTYVRITGTDMWSDTNSDPITDVMNAQDAVEAKTGTRPSILIVSKRKQ